MDTVIHMCNKRTRGLQLLEQTRANVVLKGNMETQGQVEISGACSGFRVYYRCGSLLGVICRVGDLGGGVISDLIGSL
jgi:hypothetical protein